MGMKLPGKFKMTVSGCNLNCAESWVRDVGLFGKPDPDKPEPYRVEKLNRHSLPVTVYSIGFSSTVKNFLCFFHKTQLVTV